MPLQFVNFRGDAVSTAAPPAKKTTRKAVSSNATKAHLGFVAEGFSPEMLDKAREAHKKLNDERVANLRSPLDPFSAHDWMSKAKPKRIRTQPYSIESSAAECCRLAEKAGWLNCRVSELIKMVDA